MLVRPLSTVDNTRDYARVSHSRQWSNYNVNHFVQWPPLKTENAPHQTAPHNDMFHDPDSSPFDDK